MTVLVCKTFWFEIPGKGCRTIVLSRVEQNKVFVEGSEIIKMGWKFLGCEL